jgi:methylamine---glutamate N-methyltransferase subunit A
MCGIVGLLAKTQSMRDRLGELLVPMLVCMTERGPDSTGLAVFSGNAKAPTRFNLHGPGDAGAWDGLVSGFKRDVYAGAVLERTSEHGVLVAEAPAAQVKSWLAQSAKGFDLLSVGRAMDLYKDIGPAQEVSDKYGFAGLKGTHAIGHTRMATESAVSLMHAHPFTTGGDFCLVHNGSLSNYHSLRRMLERRGIMFETDNDTEAACRFIQWHLRNGDSIEQAIVKGFEELDGFYTLLMGTADRLVLVRDAFACKPAVVAETDDYVAVASEFRSLADLPDIDNAKLFEPEPERIYSWAV